VAVRPLVTQSHGGALLPGGTGAGGRPKEVLPRMRSPAKGSTNLPHQGLVVQLRSSVTHHPGVLCCLSTRFVPDVEESAHLRNPASGVTRTFGPSGSPPAPPAAAKRPEVCPKVC
jgi:hypothetical protein